MSSISWTDAIGAASLANAFPYPGNRFRSWTPANKPFGEHSTNLGTGQRNVTAFRDDLTVSLEIPGIPNSDQSLMLRLEMHLRRGGSVTLDTLPDVTIPIFGDCKLAPGADVQISGPDKQTLEYSFSTVLRGGADVSLGASPDGTEGELLIWFKADIPAWPSLVLPAGASLLDQQNDVTGNGNHGVAPQASMRPRFDLAVQNGLPGVFFSVDNLGDPTYSPVDRLRCPSGCLLPAKFTSLEGFFVLKRSPNYLALPESGGPHEMGSGTIGANQNGHYPLMSGPNVGHVIDTFGSSAQQDAGAPGIDFSEAHLYNPSSTAGGVWQARFNGVLTADYTGAGYGIPDPVIFNTHVQVGAATPDGSNAFDGWELEAMVYSPKRTTVQRSNITEYNHEKWGLVF